MAFRPEGYAGSCGAGGFGGAGVVAGVGLVAGGVFFLLAAHAEEYSTIYFLRVGPSVAPGYGRSEACSVILAHPVK